jgi:hypothetical protein
MPDFKLLGSNTLTATESAGVMTQGLGFPLRTVDTSAEPEAVLIAFDDTIQEPTTTDDPLQVTFGPAQGAASDAVSLAADGTLTFNEDGFYAFLTTLKFGRQGGAGGVALLFLRALLDDVQVGRPVATEVDNSNIIIPQQFEFALFLSAGTELKVEIYRDSAGQDDGGLFPSTSTLGWGISPSARMRIYKT